MTANGILHNQYLTSINIFFKSYKIVKPLLFLKSVQ